MEPFNAEISIGDTERCQWIHLSATVDTSTFMMFVPGSLLQKLGLPPASTQKVQTADGRLRDMDVAYTWIRANGREMMTYIVFNDEETEPVMGRLAVNSLLLTVDPMARKLVPMTNIPI